MRKAFLILLSTVVLQFCRVELSAQANGFTFKHIEKTVALSISNKPPTLFAHSFVSPIQAVLTPEWQAEELPIFCKLEFHLEKRSGIPFRFRLGSVDYVDWLEGKPNASFGM